MSRGFQAQLKTWFKSNAGKVIYAQEKAQIDAALENLFGYFLVQLGSVTEQDLTSESRIGTKLIIDADQAVEQTLQQGIQWVQADFDFLPLAKESVDLVLLPHTLEAVDDPYFVLRQVDSMLLGEGHIVITGFNPIGCLSVWLKHFTQSGGFGRAKFRRAVKIKEWLEVLGYEVIPVKYTPVMCFTGNEKYKRWGRMIEKIERSLQWMGIEFGNIYCIVARKKVDSPTLVGAKWHLPRWGRATGSVTTQRFKPYKKTDKQLK